MFKLKSVAFLFCFISTIANAQPFEVTRPLQCDTASEVFKIIPQFNEVPVWQGRNDNGLVNILTLNPQTQTWTLIVTDGEKACVVDSGKGFMVNQNPAPQPRQPQNNRNQDPKNLKDI